MKVIIRGDARYRTQTTLADDGSEIEGARYFSLSTKEAVEYASSGTLSYGDIVFNTDTNHLQIHNGLCWEKFDNPLYVQEVSIDAYEIF